MITEISIRERIYSVISDVFGVPVEELNDDSSPDTIPGWDSLSHLHLFLALEDEFGVSLSDADIADMLSVRLIRIILAEYGLGDAD